MKAQKLYFTRYQIQDLGFSRRPNQPRHMFEQSVQGFSILQGVKMPIFWQKSDTWNTAIGGLKVCDEVFATRLNAEQLSVWDGDDTGRPAAAALLHVVEHVGKTSDIVVDLKTAPHPHTTVASGRYQNHLIRC